MKRHAHINISQLLPSTIKKHDVEGNFIKDSILSLDMVYIYKKHIAGKPQYYLRVSERKGARVLVKDIAYLGSSITQVQKRLDNLPDYQTQIRKAHKNLQRVINANIWLEKVQSLKLKKNEYLGTYQDELEACHLHYKSQFLKKAAITRKQILEQFAIDFTYNTTSLEGNTITLTEAQKLVTQGLTPASRTVREVHDVQNTQRVFLDWNSFTISHDSIIALHAELLKHIDNRVGYRLEDVRVYRSRFDVTPAKYVKADMDILLEWYEKKRDTLHPVVLACIFHHKFEKIHPFMDGNGRSGRMLANIILMQNRYPPVIIDKKLRSQYLDALSLADTAHLDDTSSKTYADLVQFVTKELCSKYWNFFL